MVKILKAFLYFLFIVFLSLYLVTMITDYYNIYIDPPETSGEVEYIDYYIDFFSDTEVNFGLHIYGDKTRKVIEEYDNTKREEEIQRLQESFKQTWGIGPEAEKTKPEER